MYIEQYIDKPIQILLDILYEGNYTPRLDKLGLYYKKKLIENL